MLEIKELTKYYGKNLAVDQVTFTVPNGQVGVLLGPNGSGKSTIIKSIAGLLRYQGEIRIKGIPARQIPAKRKFAYVPEIPNMFDALTVREHIEYVRMAYDSEITDEEIEKILKAFEMDDKQVERTMLEIKELTKYYGKNLAVDQVTFTVPNGQVGVLLGPNGSGKSTIIKSIAGLLRYQGEIRIKGIPARQIPAKRKFAYVPEIPNMFDALTVREHIEYVRMAYDSEITDEEIEKILKAFEMDDKQDKLGNELSKGMMQKVSICCALAVKPEVILLDEPMVGLDPAAIKMLKDVVLKLRDNGATVLISTHMLEMVENLWDVMIVMEQGHIAGSYTKADAQGKELDELFFEMTGGEKA